AQVLAVSELLGNLATRTEWRGHDLVVTVDRIRPLLEEAARLGSASEPDLAAARAVVAASVPDPADNEGLLEARAAHLAALAGVQAWFGRAAEGELGELRADVDAFAVDHLDAEMANLRTGMYRRGSA
ncbi:MAG: hypothetical protein ACRD29_22620, partial [Acidimicrobiales bacterium]